MGGSLKSDPLLLLLLLPLLLLWPWLLLPEIEGNGKGMRSWLP
jgi:hypothetical protein